MSPKFDKGPPMSLLIEIKVTPSSGKQGFAVDKSGNLKCFLKSSPVGGKANAELIKFLSKKLKVRQNQVIILSGETSRKKRLKIEEKISFEEFCKIMGLQLQKELF